MAQECRSLELLHTGGCSPDGSVDGDAVDAHDDLAEELADPQAWADGEDELRLRRVMQRLRDHIERECDAPRPRDPSRAHRSVSGEILTSGFDS